MPEKEYDFDLVLRGGRVIDGTRMPGFLGDVAIKDGLIAEIGTVSGKGSKEIDAQGLIVAPGFIDVHTHYDAQLNWDPYASQSCWHGVTSIVISACGFGFAPCRPEDRERAMRRMTRVEAIPYEGRNALGLGQSARLLRLSRNIGNRSKCSCLYSSITDSSMGLG